MVSAFASPKTSFEARPLSPTALKIGLFVAFVLVWTVYGAITGLSSAVHHDTAEAYIWGREFQLGYYKHPPFWAWIAGAWFTFAPHQDWAFRLLAVINAAIGLLGSWRLIGNFAEGRTRAAATLLLLLTPCFTFLAYKFNANSIFLSVWPWTMHYFVKSFDNRRLADAAFFGAFLAAAMLSKYFAVILVATCGIAILAQPGGRRYFASPSPYVSLAVALLALSPHIWWLYQTGFLPFHYFEFETGRSYTPVAAHAVGTLGALIALHFVVIAVIASCSTRPVRQWWRNARELWRTPRTRMLIVLSLAPTLLTVAVALVCRNKVSANMLIGTVSLMPLLVIKLGGVEEGRLLRRAAIAATTVSLISVMLSPAIAVAKMQFSQEPDVMQPRAEASLVVTRIWHSLTRAPLTYVAGSEFYANATSFYSADHPHVFIDFDYREAPWVTRTRLMQDGLLVLCDDNDASCLANARRTLWPPISTAHFTLAHAYAGIAKPAVHFTAFIAPPAIFRERQ